MFAALKPGPTIKGTEVGKTDGSPTWSICSCDQMIAEMDERGVPPDVSWVGISLVTMASPGPLAKRAFTDLRVRGDQAMMSAGTVVDDQAYRLETCARYGLSSWRGRTAPFAACARFRSGS